MKRTRRSALAALAAAPLAPLCVPRTAHAIGPGSKLKLAQLLYTGGNPVPRPTALRRLSWEVEKRTSVDMALEPVRLRVRSGQRGGAREDLFRHPFLYLGGDSAFAPFPDEDLARLKRFLVYGGFLLVDSAEARPGEGFDSSVRKLAADLFPSRPLAKLAPGHTLSKSFYLLGRPVGRVATVPHLEGITRDGRTLLVYCQNDMGGAWARDNFGQWEHSVYPGGARQRELAIRWGVNLVMYALCVDYKADQVHIPFILKRRRWRVGP